MPSTASAKREDIKRAAVVAIGGRAVVVSADDGALRSFGGQKVASLRERGREGQQERGAFIAARNLPDGRAA